MPTNASPAIVKLLIALAIALAIGVGAFALIRQNQPGGQTEAYKLDMGEQFRIEPQLIHYQQAEEFAANVTDPRVMTIGPDDRIYIAGYRAVQILDARGQPEKQLPLPGKAPTCIAVAGPDHKRPGGVYVGLQNKIRLFTADGQEAGEWADFGPKALFTSLAIAGDSIFAADAGNRIVLQLDPAGAVQHRIGDSRGGKNAPGFIIPSPYFDLVAGADGLVHVVNPGARRVETFASTGELETVWGRAGSNLEAFFGCCNPAHLARLPDGRFVTSEKGVPRVKIYNSEGKFESVVAGPEQLGVPLGALGDAREDTEHTVFDIATDSKGRVMALDPDRGSVRVFVEAKNDKKASDAGAEKEVNSSQ